MRLSSSTSGMWKRSTVWIMRHRQTKEPDTDRPSLNHRATSRLYKWMTQLNEDLGQLGNQEEPLPSASLCSRKRQMDGWDEPCESRGSRTVL